MCIVEQGNLRSESRNDTESGNKYDDYSTLEPIFSEEEIDKMSPGDKSDSETMSTDMLEYMHDENKSHKSINRR